MSLDSFSLPPRLLSFLLFLHVASIPHFKIASLFLKDRGRPFYSNFYLDEVRLQLIRKPFRQYLNANGLWKPVPSPWRSGSSLFSQRATVAFLSSATRRLQEVCCWSRRSCQCAATLSTTQWPVLLLTCIELHFFEDYN